MLANASLQIASSNTNITLTLGAPQYVRAGENTIKQTLILPIGEYQLTTYYAFSEHPEDIRFVQPTPFSFGKEVDGQLI
jgi:hypothetical protein